MARFRFHRLCPPTTFEGLLLLLLLLLLAILLLQTPGHRSRYGERWSTRSRLQSATP